MSGRKYYLIFLFALTLFITYLHYTTIPENHELHNIYAELYYIPVLLGALAFGVKGAILTYLFVSVVYVPYIFLGSSETFLALVDKSLHIVFTGAFAVIAGLLIDREKKYQRQQEKNRYLAGLGRSASAIAHDLKNPLITISGFARRIKDGKGNIEKASQVIIDSAEKMEKIVHDVLDFAKPIRLNLEEVDINEIINSACDSCSRKAKGTGVALALNLSPEPVSLPLDGLHIERALVNLINNAIEASSSGQRIHINVVPGEEIISITIKDYGAGMDKETLGNVFIPFYSLKDSGTGLGMAIAKKIIEEHQGAIRLTSEPEFGTEVIIKLPRNITGNVRPVQSSGH